MLARASGRTARGPGRGGTDFVAVGIDIVPLRSVPPISVRVPTCRPRPDPIKSLNWTDRLDHIDPNRRAKLREAAKPAPDSG